ncbi:penicillin-binding protein 2 [candidate division KSB1 bacterium]|nr:penicillin-binding protein 2 [candidate division KSB1 bacterium]
MNASQLQNRYRIFVIGISVAFFVLLCRFFYLQIYQRARYFQESERNRIQKIVLQPTRGIMYDRNGVVLVDNRPSYSVYAIPFETKKADSVFELTATILSMDVGEVKDKIRRYRRSQFAPVKLKRQIDFTTLSEIEENRLSLPGIIYDIEPRRAYSSGVRAPHLFGYLGEITDNELEVAKDSGYRLGDIIGKKGLEKVYEDVLQGLRGFRYVEVDAFGREVRTLKDKPEMLPLPGKNLHLSIDAELQKFLEARMDTLQGGAVVVDCRNGEVLALVSKPDYEPEIFTKPITQDVWNGLINDPRKPLYDRMVQSLYPPGSTFKLVVASAALESGLITKEWSSYCNGFLTFGRRTFECWKTVGHKDVDLTQAIAQSCNVYFYKLGPKLGIDTWSEYAKKFRFGERTGIDLINENAGLVPTQKYLDETYGAGKWSQGLMLNLAVGQGDLLVTPLQLVSLAMIMANKGVYHQIHLVRYIEDPIDGAQQQLRVDSTMIQGISDTTFNIVRNGMYEVVQGVHGTAKICRFRDIHVAGKTGTAQNPHGDPHAWFIGFAPYEKPEIAFCVLVENGGSGSGNAAPIARGIIDHYFHKSKRKLAYEF